MYADDTSSKCASKTWEVTEEAMMKVSDNLSSYANENQYSQLQVDRLDIATQS